MALSAQERCDELSALLHERDPQFAERAERVILRIIAEETGRPLAELQALAAP